MCAVLRNHEEQGGTLAIHKNHLKKSRSRLSKSHYLSHALVLHPIQISTKQGDIPAKKLHIVQ